MSNIKVSGLYGNYTIPIPENKKHGIVQKTSKTEKEKEIRNNDFAAALKDALEKDSNSSHHREQNKKDEPKKETVPANDIDFLTYNKAGREKEYLRTLTVDFSC